MNTIPTRICPTCGATMEQHGRAWVCPRQRDEEKIVSQEARASVKRTAEARAAGLPF